MIIDLTAELMPLLHGLIGVGVTALIALIAPSLWSRTRAASDTAAIATRTPVEAW